jgi:hypothetical protein
MSIKLEITFIHEMDENKKGMPVKCLIASSKAFPSQSTSILRYE